MGRVNERWVQRAFEAHQRHLWGLCFRMTGSTADADDLVQQTFQRALERPPDTTRPLRPWLAKVAVNLCRDHLRARRYQGPFLPAVVEPADYEGTSTGGRYDLLESVTVAFLLALEELTPSRRAVLLLCDVFDYGSREAAEVLGMTEGSVRTALHRARKQLAPYDRRRQADRSDVDAATRAMLQQMFERLAARDAEGFAALLAEDVQALNDANGVFHAARRPVVGPDRVTRFSLGLLGKRGMPTTFEVRELNARPTLVVAWPTSITTAPLAPTAAITVVLDERGKVWRYCSQMAPEKLRRLRRG